MARLCVPYYNGKPDSWFDEKSVAGYLLYSVDLTNDHDSKIWWGTLFEKDKDDPETARATASKFKGLQKYFEKRHHTCPCPADFQMRTWNTFPLKDKAKKPKHLYLKILNQQTFSVFFGIFLAALHKIQRREFNDGWDIICATGDVDYNEKSGEVIFSPVAGIMDKFSGEFKAEANKYKEKKHLFVYIGDKDEIPAGNGQGENRNITVKRFPPGNTLESIMNDTEVFKPFDYNFDFNYIDLEAERNELLDDMTNIADKEAFYGFIPGSGFETLERSVINDPNWRGFFMHGEGGSGKTTTTMAIVRYLVWTNKIWAPVWIKMDNEEIKKIIEDEAREGLTNKREMSPAVASQFATRSPSTDGIVEYISGKFEKPKPRVGELNETNKEHTKDYLVVIDNLELPDNGLKRVLGSILKLFPDLTTRPYLIITSRNICDDSDIIARLHLQPEEPPKLATAEQVAVFVKSIVKKMPKECSEKIDRAEKSDAFKELVEALLHNFGGNPDLIIVSIGLLRHMSVAELSGEINERLGGGETDIRKKRTEIYEMVFSYLNKMQMQVLYLFLEIGYDNPISPSDIHERIRKAEHWRETPINEQALKEILRVLFNNNLIYTKEHKHKTLYGIKSVPWHTVLFEKEFLGPKSESGEYLRDVFVPLDWQLGKAFRYNQDVEIIRPLLEKMRAKGMEVTEPLFDAARYSKNPEVFHLLRDFGCNLDICDELGLTVAHSAASGENIAVLDWLFVNAKALLYQTNNNGLTVAHFAASGENIAVLDWLLDNTKDLLYQTNNNGLTVAHCVIAGENTDALDWLLANAKDLLYQANIRGWTVAHYATFGKNIDVLGWLRDNAKDLLYQTGNHGSTVAHCVIAGKIPTF